MALVYCKLIIAVVLGSYSLSGNSTNDIGSLESLKSQCINRWMEKINKSKDIASYQNLGEKYCECMQAQSPEDKTSDKDSTLCLSQTLLQDIMASIENEIGLDKATEEDISAYCEDRTRLISPQTDSNSNTTNYCTCVKPKLLNLIAKAESMSEQHYDNQINKIAATCSF
ncbi:MULTISPECIES: hypothetical protein [unclassified Legionella]|uniref:hypothetical protein n=1 Tax=unclassified Legionella TaxID=2622702 RepID=UPI0010555212|nr:MULTISPECIES: hypothetical protein [unclassified Legionella]MDI9818281.1 hypothetical protein [Legionella sp. PL877]